MNYHDLKRYLQRLKSQNAKRPQNCSIDWAVVDPVLLDSKPHKDCNGLQMADVVATSYRFALEKTHCNHTTEHAKILGPKAFCCPQGSILGRGLKVFPTETELSVRADGDFEWLR